MPLPPRTEPVTRPVQQVDSSLEYVISAKSILEDEFSEANPSYRVGRWRDRLPLPKLEVGMPYKVTINPGNITIAEAHKVAKIIFASPTQVEFETEASRFKITLSKTADLIKESAPPSEES